MATIDIQPGFLAARGNGQTGATASGLQDEFIPFRISETITLSTTGTTTDSAEYLLPGNAVILGVTSTIVTALAGSGVSGYTLGDSAVAARFASVSATAAGSTSTGTVMLNGNINATNAGPTQASAAKLRVTTSGGTATSGAVRVTVFGFYGRPVAA